MTDFETFWKTYPPRWSPRAKKWKKNCEKMKKMKQSKQNKKKNM